MQATVRRFGTLNISFRPGNQAKSGLVAERNVRNSASNLRHVPPCYLGLSGPWVRWCPCCCKLRTSSLWRVSYNSSPVWQGQIHALRMPSQALRREMETWQNEGLASLRINASDFRQQICRSSSFCLLTSKEEEKASAAAALRQLEEDHAQEAEQWGNELMEDIALHARYIYIYIYTYICPYTYDLVFILNSIPKQTRK